MALLHLDAAARLVGKSEVTLRRLVKAGKIKTQREKTLTGFIYLVEGDDVLAYYGKRAQVQAEAPELEPAPAPKKHAVASSDGVRVAVSDESGDPSSYWARRAETYEERYHHEMQRNAALREELGLWKGRAENAQALLVKLLPAPATVEVETKASPETYRSPKRSLSTTGITILTSVAVLIVVIAVYLYLLMHT